MATVRFTYDGGTYEFQRLRGEGRWVCVNGRCLGVIGNESAGHIVPFMHEKEISDAAIEAKVTTRMELRRFPFL